MSFSWKSLWIAGLLGGILPGGITGNEADAATNRWLGTAGVNWADDANWELGHAPIAGEQVVIDATASSHVLLTNPTPWLASFFITNRTLTFSNWTTALQATQVTVAAAGKFTLPNAFAAGAMSNRIWVICSNLTVHPQGQMIGDALGYLNAAGPGVGANGGGGGGGGAGHANRGGDGGGGGAGGAAYGDAAAPLAPGSGGGTGYDPGGKGGGAIRIEADDRVEIHGTLSVNGSKGGANSRGGGGSGGSIYITCRRFAGSTNGLISAQGADGENNQFDYCGGGGSGGRIAVLYDSTAQAAEPRPAVRFRAYGGTSYNPLAGQSDDGTLYFPDPSILTNVLQDALFKNVQLTIPGWTQWRVDSLWVSNCSFTVATPSFVLGVTQSLTIHSNGVLKLYPATVDCHTLVLTNGGQFWVTAGPTTTVNRFGAEIRVTDGLWIGAGSWVYAFADPTNGGIPRFQTGALTVQNGGGIRADNAGFQGSYGPGKGANGGAAGGAAAAMADEAEMARRRRAARPTIHSSCRSCREAGAAPDTARRAEAEARSGWKSNARRKSTGSSRRTDNSASPAAEGRRGAAFCWPAGCWTACRPPVSGPMAPTGT